MQNLLTLAIAETFPGTDDFNIIALNEKSRNLLALRLTREEIISETGEVYWDIGKWTSVQNLKLTKVDASPRNKVYTPDSAKLLDKPADIKSILEDSIKSSRDFMNDKGITYAVLKVKKLKEILVETDDKGNRKCQLDVFFSDNPAHPQKILNKDYRWVKYWSRVPKNDLDDVKDKYFRLLNKPGKVLYLILYRHYFADSDSSWIVGMHWL